MEFANAVKIAVNPRFRANSIMGHARVEGVPKAQPQKSLKERTLQATPHHLTSYQDIPLQPSTSFLPRNINTCVIPCLLFHNGHDAYRLPPTPQVSRSFSPLITGQTVAYHPYKPMKKDR
jgi:hypothetical protein